MEKNKGFSRDFCLVVAGQIISLFGNAVMRFALPLHLLDVTGSAAALGIVSGFAFLPLAVMAPLGGIIADRINKRNIMVFLDFFTCGLTLLFLAAYGKISLLGLILATLFLLYGISGVYQPSVQASVPLLVDREKIMPANAAINMVSSLSGMAGPALGGIAYAKWGILPVMAAASVCFFLSAVMEIFIRIPFARRRRSRSLLREAIEDMRGGIRYITKEKPEIGKLTICCAGVNMVLSALLIIGLPVVVMQVLDFTEDTASKMYGFLQGILAVGGLAGGMAAGVCSKKLKLPGSWKILLGCAGLLLPMGVAVCLSGMPYGAYGMIAVAGMGIMAASSLYVIQIMSYIQMTVPDEMIGKVIAWMIAVSTCAQPLGQVVYGLLFEWLKESVYIIFGTAAVVSAGIAYYAKQFSPRHS